MTISQLTYVLAVAKHRSFSLAADECFVSQPALSMQVKQLEQFLDVQLFDRSKNPITLTPIGERIVQQARMAIGEFKKIKELADETRTALKGEIRIGIIPTLATYLLPLFLKSFTQQFPHVTLRIKELTTQQIIENIGRYELDIALLATPLAVEELVAVPLFREELLAYVSPNSKLHANSFVVPHEINPDELWLLEEGHCLRFQIMKLCELKKKRLATPSVEFRAGSIETLIKLVDKYEGVTIVPYLATLDFDAKARANLRSFANPVPKREISLVYHPNFQRKSLIEGLLACITDGLPNEVKTEGDSPYTILPIF